MAIQSLIIHRLRRWQDDQPSELKLRDEECTVGADYEALFSQCKKLFQFRAGKLFGRFDEDYSQAPLQTWLKEQQDNKISFSRLSTLYANQLKELVDKTGETYEGYITCILEDRADGPRFYIFMLETSSGLLIDNQLQLDTVDPLNTSKLDLALRIELTDWMSEDDSAPYLSLIKSRTRAKIGEAFSQSIGFKSSVDTAKETETLMEMLAGYTKETEPKEAAAVRQKAYEFCVEQQQLGEAVPINELSGYLDENQPTRFAQFASEQAHIAPEHQIRPDTRKLKHLVRLSGKGNGLSLSFSSDLIQQTILFDEKSDTLTITSIPKSLKKQILEHLKDDGHE